MANSANAQIGKGVTLEYYHANASPAAYDTLGKIRSINGIGADLPEVDSTTLDSTAMEYIPGMENGKEVTIVFTTTTALVATIEALKTAAAEIQMKLTQPSPMSMSRYFSITLTGYDYGNIVAPNLQEFTIKGRITGSITTSEPSH